MNNGFDIKNGILCKYDEFAAQTKIEIIVNMGDFEQVRVVSLPNNVKVIAKSAFAKNYNIDWVVLNKGLETIENNAFYFCENLKKVDFPQSVTSIGDYAFYSCHLEEVTLGKKIKSIGSNAFAENHKLQIVNLGYGIEKIGSFEFFNCETLEYLNLPNSIKEIGMSAFSHTDLTSVDLPNISVIPAFAFEKTKLTEVAIPSSVELIDNHAFAETPLEDVNLSFGLKTIGYSAFEKCEQLFEITIPDSVKSIGRDAFSGCSKLSYVLLPMTLEKIDNGTFKGCKSLAAIDFPLTLIKIGKNAFEDAGLVEVVMHENLKEIDDEAFSGCNSLKMLRLPNSVKRIGESAFEDCEMLEIIHFPNNLEELGKCAFKNCSTLKEAHIPEKIKVLPDSVFCYCDDLREVILPKGLKTIEDNAFINCSSLEEIEFNDGLSYIGSKAFSDCESLKSVILPDSVTFIGEEAFKECKNLENVVLPKDINVIVDGMFANCKKLKKVVLPSSVKMIGFDAFAGTAIEEIDLSNVETVVDSSAFQNCESLREVILPEKLTVIKEKLFEGCKKLEKLELPKNIERIEKSAFADCEQLKIINLPERLQLIDKEAFRNCASLKSITLPSGLQTINDESFKGCTNLERLSIPRSVSYIGKDAFKGCLKLEELTFYGGTLGECLFNIGDSIEVIKISKNCKVNATRLYPMKYITKKDDFFYITADPVNEDSFPLADIDEKLSVGILMNEWDNRDKLLKEIKGKNGENIIELYNFLYSEIDNDKFDDFFKTKELKYFNQLCQRYHFTDTNFYKLFYNLGGFKKPEIETHINKQGKKVEKLVDYGQIVKELTSDVFLKSDFVVNNIKYICGDMKTNGFKREFTKFVANRETLRELLGEEVNKFGFIAKCYNFFEKVQKTNIANKGTHRQLKPTIEKFKSFFRENAFEGITDEFKNLAKVIAPYYANQKAFDDAVAIEKERQARGTPTRILKEPLSEEDAFKTIRGYSAKIRKLRSESLKTMAELAGKKFTFEWLEKNDPTNFLLGELTSSCAHLEGVGYGIMRASIIHPDIQNLVIRNKQGDIVAKSTLYINREQGYGVFNTIESEIHLTPEEKKAVYQKIKLGICTFAEKYNKENPDKPLKIVNVGIHQNRLEEEIKGKEPLSSEILPSINYQDYGDRNGDYNGDTIYGQYTIWKDNER